MRGVKPVLCRRNQDPTVAQPLVCLVSIVKLPPKSTVSSKWEGIERDILEKGRESSLESDPKRVVRTNGNCHNRDFELRSFSIIE